MHTSVLLGDLRSLMIDWQHPPDIVEFARTRLTLITLAMK